MPRTQEQFKELREKSKKHIIDTALHLFAKHGFHATPIHKIAKEAGIATGLLYNYFSGKEKLLEEIIQNAMAEFQWVLFPYLKNGVILDRDQITEMIKGFFEAIKGKAEIWRLMIRIMLEPEMAAFGKNHIGKSFQFLTDIFRSYFERQGTPDPEVRAKVLNSIIHGAFLNYLIQGDEIEFELIKNEIITKFL